jgi:hypothetical protein
VAQLPADVRARSLADARLVRLPGNVPPWTDTGLRLGRGDEVTILAEDKIVTSEEAKLWYRPRFALWARIGDRGPIWTGTRDTQSFRAATEGTLQLAVYNGEWKSPDGVLATPLEAYDATGGAIEALILHWRGEARAGLETLERAAPGEPLIAAELERQSAPALRPGGWSYLWFLGQSDTFRAVREDGRHQIACRCDDDVAILRRPIDLPLRPDTEISWRWKIDQLPSRAAEDALICHDYLSVALEFENGRDLVVLELEPAGRDELRLSDPAVEPARDAPRGALGQRGARRVAERAAPGRRRLCARDRRHDTRARRRGADRGEPVPARPGHRRLRRDRGAFRRRADRGRGRMTHAVVREFEAQTCPLRASSSPRRLARLRTVEPRLADAASDPRRCRAALEELLRRPHVGSVVAAWAGEPIGFVLAQANVTALDAPQSYFSPPHSVSTPLGAHACAGSEDPAEVYAALYAALAEQWVVDGFLDHGIGALACEREVHDAFASLGFGRHFALALRGLEPLSEPTRVDLDIREAGEKELDDVFALTAELRAFHARAPMFQANPRMLSHGQEALVRWL